jgi:hypothetical protein
MNMRDLLKNVFYGDELDALERGTSHTRRLLTAADARFRQLPPDQWTLVNDVLREHFSTRYEEAFDGCITAGDGWFIGIFMAAMQPVAMIEVGVASGYSSTFILRVAARLGLLRSDRPFLHSFDLMDVHANGGVTGQLLRRRHPEFEPHWALTTQATTVQMNPASLREALPAGPIMAFVDGGHAHPWPTIDLTFLRNGIPACEWVLMQDIQMMERWVADALIYRATIQSPIRGVQYAIAHWPGDKLIGSGLSYNMAAARLPISDANYNRFVQAMRAYANETKAEEASIFDAYFDASAAPKTTS